MMCGKDKFWNSQQSEQPHLHNPKTTRTHLKRQPKTKIKKCNILNMIE